MPLEDLRRELASLSGTVHLSRDDYSGAVSIDLISVPADLRGRGCARQALDIITAWADRHDETITLEATPNFGSDIRRLIGLYSRYGFAIVCTVGRTDVAMERTPRQEAAA
ncbi:GNAT family N-acetyltransferase [Microbacterium sp. 77mftsu3.1]|uniref:GNAT family N-acetyltransferase n=1 Tax=Microbacterium sp. 77mftsu3.1 TaxID=1761802 RepID=UPI00036B1CE0|nr:GNAT family N-acetyltransferase [Microbacterium sp. 77mftsu3.1]